jgi:hypothetical protein
MESAIKNANPFLVVTDSDARRLLLRSTSEIEAIDGEFPGAQLNRSLPFSQHDAFARVCEG